jgi:cell division septum initiation protein DivIVA
VTQSRSCFDNGRKVAEIGAALAYAEMMARRLPVGGKGTLQDLSAGLHTAAAAAERIEKDIRGKAKASAQEIAKEVQVYNEHVRRRWIDASSPVRPGDAAEIQRNTSHFRKKVMQLWDQLRQKCR